jgi:hypothetical protein
MRYIVHIAGREVIDDYHLFAFIQKLLRQVRPDKTRTSCYKVSHDTLLFKSRLIFL